jgi:preprotein translocase subunit Sss1
MNRFFAVLATFVVMTAAVHAEPLPWTYSVWLKPAGGSDSILYGTEVGDGPFGNTSYYVLSNFGAAGTSATGNVAPGTTDLFGFSNGNWKLETSFPSGANPSNGAFELQYLFTTQASGSSTNSVSGMYNGTISTSGVFTSGTGNFTLGLDGDTEILLDGQKARVQFGTRQSESQSVVTMTVTPGVVETPEPATIALAGIGLAGVVGYRGRRLRKGGTAV